MIHPRCTRCTRSSLQNVYKTSFNCKCVNTMLCFGKLMTKTHTQKQWHIAQYSCNSCSCNTGANRLQYRRTVTCNLLDSTCSPLTDVEHQLKHQLPCCFRAYRHLARTWTTRIHSRLRPVKPVFSTMLLRITCFAALGGFLFGYGGHGCVLGGASPQMNPLPPASTLYTSTHRLNTPPQQL